MEVRTTCQGHGALHHPAEDWVSEHLHSSYILTGHKVRRVLKGNTEHTGPEKAKEMFRPAMHTIAGLCALEPITLMFDSHHRSWLM